MLANGALALTTIDVAFFAPPPHRPSRRQHGSDDERGMARDLIASIRRAFSRR
jgi:hypothetical protein